MKQLPVIGDVGAVRHKEWYTFFAKMIHFALNKWHRDWCRRNLKKYHEVKTTHNFLVVLCPESKYRIGAGESLGLKGTVVTPWEVYEKKIAKGRVDVWIFDTGFTFSEREAVNSFWHRECKGRPYDWRAIWDFWRKVIGEDFSDTLKDLEFAFFCTESVQCATSQVKDLFQCEHATPMQVEQAAGWLSRKEGIQTTLKERFHLTGAR